MDPITVFSFDVYLVPFIKGNLITLGLLLPVLKAVAKATPWAIDDEILQIVTEFKNKKAHTQAGKKV